RLEDETFLACLAKATAERRSVSLHTPATNYAPKIFENMPRGKGVGRRGFERAMQRLLDRGEILNDQQVYQYPNRTWARGLGLAQSGAQSPHKAVHEGCTKPSTNPAQSRTHTGGYTTYRAGAAHEPLRPAHDQDATDQFDDGQHDPL